MSIEDLLDEYPELEDFDINDLEDMNEFELFDLIDEFDRIEGMPKSFGENLQQISNNLKKIDFSEENKEEIKKEHDFSEEQYDLAEKLNEKIQLAENHAKPSSSDSGIKALNEGTLSIAETVIYVTEGDDKVCPKCEESEGNEYDVDPITRIVIDGPLIPDDKHPNCRCRYLLLSTAENIGEDIEL